MTLTLYINNSDDRVVSKNLTQIVSYDGTLRVESSIHDPVINIQANVSDLATCNYFYISEFGRYYYITDIRSIRSNICEISGRCDVLMTYATQIKACSGIYNRNENSWNLYLDDGALRVYNNPMILTKEFPSGFSGGAFVLAVAGS